MFSTTTVAVAAALFIVPLFTTREKTYVPNTVGTNVGLTAVELDIVTDGPDVCIQE